MEKLMQLEEQLNMEVSLKIKKKIEKKMMIVDRQYQHRLGVKKIEMVNTYVYLGSLIANQGRCSEGIKILVEPTKQAITKLTKIWKSHHITLYTEMDWLRACCFLYSFMEPNLGH